MRTEQRLLQQVIEAHRGGDLDECVRWVRTLVYAAPLATAPRHLLASLYMLTGEHRLALLHYRRLLPPAIERGEVFRAIAVQKQIDDLTPARSHDTARWVSLRTRLHLQGVQQIPAGAAGRPWLEVQFLGLSREWFERVVTETRAQVVGAGAATELAGASTVWEVVAGRLFWSYALPDGRENSRAEAGEGDAIHLPAISAGKVRFSFFPDLPVELLRFDAALAADLRGALVAGRGAQGPRAGASRATPGGASRPALSPAHAAWTKRVQELAGAGRDRPEGIGPKVLGAPSPGVTPPSDPSRDTGDWVEYGVLALPDAPAASGADRGASAADDGATVPPAADDAADLDLSRDEPPAASAEPAPDTAPGERTIDLPAASTGPARTRRRRTPKREQEAEAGDGFIEPHAADPFAQPIPPPAPDGGRGAERRRHPRVAVSFETRVALLRLRGSRVPPLRGELIDLSANGLGLRVASPGLGASGGALAQAVVAVELAVPGPGGPLQVAGQVRRIEVDEARDEARIGIEFVLMTEPDRRRISATLAGVAIAARDAERG